MGLFYLCSLECWFPLPSPFLYPLVFASRGRDATRDFQKAALHACCAADLKRPIRMQINIKHLFAPFGPKPFNAEPVEAESVHTFKAESKTMPAEEERKNAETQVRVGAKVKQWFGITAFSKEGTAVVAGTDYYRKGNALHVDQVENKVITASGQIGNPAEVKVLCSVCGHLEFELFRCAHCRRALCVCCYREIQGSEGGVKLCPDHYREAMYHFDTWDAHDRQNGLPARKKYLP